MTQQDPPIRLKNVAQRAGVSLATASMALAGRAGVKEETRRRVWQVSRELGYARVRGRRSGGQALRVGVVRIAGQNVPTGTPPSVFYGAVARGDPSFRIEYAATLPDASTAQVIEHVLEFATGLDGLILTDLVSRPLLEALHANRVPHVVTGNVVEEGQVNPPLPSCVVGFDLLAMGVLATRYLFNRGHCHVAFICHTMPANFQHEHWLRGFRLAHVERQRQPSPALIAVTQSVRGGVPAAIQRMLALKQRPTALVVPDGGVVLPALASLERLGHVMSPADIVISMLDETVHTHGLEAHPRLAGRVDLLVHQALHLLQRLIREGDPTPIAVTVPFTMHNIELDTEDAA